MEVTCGRRQPFVIGSGDNRGRSTPKGPRGSWRAEAHHFADRELGNPAPNGVYDLAANQGWVGIGIDHDKAEFAIEGIRSWWLSRTTGSLPQTIGWLH